ncbi:hypothetical protein ACP70R_017430 [Stipagrostis hirtigluma subsp. patula]
MVSAPAFSRCSLLLLLLLATASQALKIGNLLGKLPVVRTSAKRKAKSELLGVLLRLIGFRLGIVVFVDRGSIRAAAGHANPSSARIPPLLRYGKYCGILYSGCPGEMPCDALDACCMIHDYCVDSHNNDYLNLECNENLLSCLDRVSPAGPTFPGNQCGVGRTKLVIRGVIETAVLAGKVLHNRDGGGQ